ncbi:zinc-dependent alcohol dehydrogenase family protein [Aspergillus clavatus NRRL 1]|uniref:Alcohol dehydrogenase n=1 Tax=Aspergillus clavatus (strain ATCC 1007 / CBS 513.65 / DSM 816 / NCTC 3887 / NRRL 1 / QM 1276 / 107) TaxID=344612 RepID=A1CC26_ASPCL|nr:alcohol dehydrogenase [Aspergillus clavatus NRRL 1]EAW13294.1 alcohol dehydrogenase [Aspergillus clavatus NRRL 1]
MATERRIPSKMKGLIYAGPNTYRVEDRPVPDLRNPTDAIVKMLYSTICGTDLHILKGDVPTVEQGRILGHEGVGTIASLGPAVQGLAEGDLVLISCMTSCGVCPACRKNLHSHCQTGGWKLGNTIDGTQAEYVRIPHAACSLYKLSSEIDPKACVALSDALPTGWECGTINATVQPAGRVVIVGAGPVGLSALMTAKLYTPSLIVVVDQSDTRLGHAKRLGADETVNPQEPGAMEKLNLLTDGEGFDSVIEAVGIPATFELSQQLVAAGGHIANVGVHGQPVALKLNQLWDRNISIKTRLVDTVTIPSLLRLYQSGKLDPSVLFTHYYPFSKIDDAYHSFQNPSEGDTLKVGIEF